MESGSPATDTAPAQEIETSTSETSPGIPGIPTQGADWASLLHGARFTTNGRYICGFVDSSQELLQTLENYRTITGTGFSNAQSLTAAMKQVEHNVWQQRFMSPASRPRLFWQMNAGEPSIPYDGAPFISIGQNTDLPCVRYGGRRKRTEQVALATGDVVPIDYRTKTGCEAKITVRRIFRYPCAQVTDVSTQGIATVRRMRKQALEELTQKIVAGITKPVDRFYFLLPTPLAHSGHAVPEIDTAPVFIQPVTDEIMNQLNRGVTEITHIRDQVKAFVDATFGAEGALHVNDPAYYPNEFDVFRHVYWLYKTGQVIDQESAFKAKLGVPFMEQEYSIPNMTDTMEVSPSKIVTATSDTITSVYSIIMDDGEGGGGTLELSDNQIRTDSEVELNSTDEREEANGSPITNQTATGAIVTVSAMPAPTTFSHTSVPAHLPRRIPGMVAKSSQSAAASGSSAAIKQSQGEVRDMLRIIGNQSHACTNQQALNTLRRQLTELCSQFSMYLAGVPTKGFDVPPAKRAKT